MKARNVAILQALGYLPTDEAEPVEGDSPTAEPQAEPDPTPDDPLKATRLRAARTHGLPEALADRLQGDSDAAVMLDAQRLARSLTSPAVNAGEVEALSRRRAREEAAAKSLMPRQSGEVLTTRAERLDPIRVADRDEVTARKR